jgi:ABC-2 type transport system permease protein
VIGLVESEFLKLRTTRTFWGLAGAALALVLLIVVLNVAISESLGAKQDVRSLLATTGLCGVLTLVLGVVAGAGEYRHGTIASTLLVTPQRLRAVAAQVLACALAGFAIGIAVAAITAAIALPWLSAKDAAMPGGGELVRVFLGSALYSGLAAALGVGLGALLRNQVAAVVIVLVQIFVVDPTLAVLIDGSAQFTLTGLGVSMSGAESDSDSDALPLGTAALVWAGYATLFGVLAAIRTAHRDI